MLIVAKLLPKSSKPVKLRATSYHSASFCIDITAVISKHDYRSFSSFLITRGIMQCGSVVEIAGISVFLPGKSPRRKIFCLISTPIKIRDDNIPTVGDMTGRDVFNKNSGCCQAAPAVTGLHRGNRFQEAILIFTLPSMALFTFAIRSLRLKGFSIKSSAAHSFRLIRPEE